jgi:hypothetical protein
MTGRRYCCGRVPIFVALLNFEWAACMRVETGKVELAGDQEDHGAHGAEAAVAARLALGRLGEPIERFEKAVGLPGLGPILFR